MQEHHKALERSAKLSSNTLLAMAPLMHLYELIQRPSQKGVVLNEFRTRSAMIDNKEVFIWEDLDDRKIEEWIEHWKFVKEKGYEAFFLDKDRGYPKFYKYRYKPMENDFRLFIAGRRSVNKGLFYRETRRNAFWEWFLSTYLRENIYPIIKS